MRGKRSDGPRRWGQAQFAAILSLAVVVGRWVTPQALECEAGHNAAATFVDAANNATATPTFCGIDHVIPLWDEQRMGRAVGRPVVYNGAVYVQYAPFWRTDDERETDSLCLEALSAPTPDLTPPPPSPGGPAGRPIKNPSPPPPPPPPDVCPAPPAPSKNTLSGSRCGVADLEAWYGPQISNNADAVLVAFDIGTGAEVWRASRPCASDTSPVLDADTGRIFFSCDSTLGSSVAGMLAVDGVTQQEAWYWEAPPPAAAAAGAAAPPQRAFSDPVTTGAGLVVWSSPERIVVLDVVDGTEVWRLDGELKSQPAATADFVFVIFADSILQKLHAANGTAAWAADGWCHRAMLPPTSPLDLGYNGILHAPLSVAPCVAFTCTLVCNDYAGCPHAEDVVYLVAGDKVQNALQNGSFVTDEVSPAPMTLLAAQPSADAVHGFVSTAQNSIAVPFVYNDMMSMYVGSQGSFSYDSAKWPNQHRVPFIQPLLDTTREKAMFGIGGTLFWRGISASLSVTTPGSTNLGDFQWNGTSYDVSMWGSAVLAGDQLFITGTDLWLPQPDVSSGAPQGPPVGEPRARGFLFALRLPKPLEKPTARSTRSTASSHRRQLHAAPPPAPFNAVSNHDYTPVAAPGQQPPHHPPPLPPGTVVSPSLSPATPGSLPPPPLSTVSRDSSKRKHVGAIVGGSVAAFLVLLAVAAIVVIYARRRRTTRLSRSSSADKLSAATTGLPLASKDHSGCICISRSTDGARHCMLASHDVPSSPDEDGCKSDLEHGLSPNGTALYRAVEPAYLAPHSHVESTRLESTLPATITDLSCPSTNVPHMALSTELDTSEASGSTPSPLAERKAVTEVISSCYSSRFLPSQAAKMGSTDSLNSATHSHAASRWGRTATGTRSEGAAPRWGRRGSANMREVWDVPHVLLLDDPSVSVAGVQWIPKGEQLPGSNAGSNASSRRGDAAVEAAAAAAVGGAADVLQRETDMSAMLTAVQPSSSAAAQQRSDEWDCNWTLEELCVQLNALTATKTPLAGRYQLTKERKAGGQGLVVFATMTHGPALERARPGRPHRVAVKFHFNSSAFQTEAKLGAVPRLRGCLPEMIQSSADAGEPVRGATGKLFPPFVVQPRGEPLDEFCARRTPDFPNCLMILMHLAEKLEAVHEAGLVHRDIKPANSIYLDEKHEWNIIDFGCAVEAGSESPIYFTLRYAAPEIVQAVASRKLSMVADPSLDVWSLGVVAFELLTRSRAMHLSRQELWQRLLGNAPLPWEEANYAEQRARLGLFASSVEMMLSRDPRKRPSMTAILEGWKQSLGLSHASSTPRAEALVSKTSSLATSPSLCSAIATPVGT